MSSRDNMKYGVPYFTGQCTNCKSQIIGAMPELIYALWEDGSSDQHTACSKCLQVIKAHNEKIEKMLEAAAKLQAPPEQQVVDAPDDEEYQGFVEPLPPIPQRQVRQAPAPPPPRPPRQQSGLVDVEVKGALQTIGMALTSLAEGQAEMLKLLKPAAKVVAPKAKPNAKPAIRRR